jgi:bla regulator protein blaR1
MNSLTKLFPSWTETLGWTLLHSLWQCLLILAFVILILRFIPARLSKIRYIILCSGIGVMLAVSVGTFIYLFERERPALSVDFSLPQVVPNNTPVSFRADKITSDLESVLRANMSLIVLCWIVGTILCSLRVVSGWWYISRLRAETFAPDQHWVLKLEHLAKELNVARLVKLAYSNKVTAPIVLGYLKPMILIPAGMLAGLSTQQVEAIFIHELAHIRRHDYVINILQSLIETILFFNPFVWMVSGMIRREREYCCDDEVIRRNGSALVYAKTLTHLEEIRLSNPALGLSLAQNKNQLLNRIRRIMENSAKNYSGREKVMPAVLIIVGLICASWLTLKADANFVQEKSNERENAAADTIGKKGEKSARYARQAITHYDDKGETREETESFEGDEEFRSIMPDMSFDFHMPQFPVPPSFPNPVLPGVPGLLHFESMIPPVVQFTFDGDSLPGRHFRYRSEEDWNEFSKEFEKKFQEQFGDFYKTHEKDFEKMMKDVEESFHEKFDERELDLLREQAFEMKEIHKIHEDAIRDAHEQARRAEELTREHMDEWHENHQKQLEQIAHKQMLHADHLKVLERDLKQIEDNLRAMEKELQQELVKDGYIDKADKVKTLKWDDNGNLEVNGNKIKESDQKKYKALRDKYFRNERGHHVLE